MTGYADVNDLMSDDSPETEDVTLPSGKVIKVRGLSRYEYMLAGKNAGDDANLFESRFLHYGVVEPKLSLAQTEAWTKKSNTKVIGPVTEAIRRLSGLVDDADKSDVS